MSTSLQPVADTIVRLAKRQGFVLARDVRAELALVGLPEAQWKDVVALARPVLIHRQGRYYHKDAFTPRLQKEHALQHAVLKIIRRLVKQHRRGAKDDERRAQVRVDFIHAVTVRTEDGQAHTLISRDLSATGVRLLGTKRLLGQKVQLELPGGEGQPVCKLLTRILWTCAVGDDLFENGGSFLEIV